MHEAGEAGHGSPTCLQVPLPGPLCCMPDGHHGPLYSAGAQEEGSLTQGLGVLLCVLRLQGLCLLPLLGLRSIRLPEGSQQVLQ